MRHRPGDAADVGPAAAAAPMVLAAGSHRTLVGVEVSSHRLTGRLSVFCCPLAGSQRVSMHPVEIPERDVLRFNFPSEFVLWPPEEGLSIEAEWSEEEAAMGLINLTLVTQEILLLLNRS